MLREQLSQGDTDDRFAKLAFELSDQVIQMPIDIEQMVFDGAQEIVDGSGEGDIGRELQEKYNLAYNPENVTRGIGSTVLVGVRVGEVSEREIIGAVTTPDTESYADKDVPDTHEYRSGDAQKIIAGLLNGDESVLRALPQLFQEALSVRMNQRINELDDGMITEGYFKEEVTKMVQVASNGMWAADFPVDYEEFMKSR